MGNPTAVFYAMAVFTALYLAAAAFFAAEKFIGGRLRKRRKIKIRYKEPSVP